VKAIAKADIPLKAAERRQMTTVLTMDNNCIPLRISRAQPKVFVFDALSSSCSTANHWTLFRHTNYGTTEFVPVKVLVGEGVSGLRCGSLSSIVTARSLGAIVQVRRDQVQSLGAEFLLVGVGVKEAGELGGGNANEMCPEFIVSAAAEMALFRKQKAADEDVIVSMTATIPGKKGADSVRTNNH